MNMCFDSIVYVTSLFLFGCICIQHDDLDLSEDAGVSRAMATVFSVQKRFPYLLAHGMIHLTGYDHENDEDWLRMTQKEDEVLRALAVEFPSCILSPPL